VDLSRGGSMQATIWEGLPFVIIALLWLFVLIVLLIVRTALYLQGEVRWSMLAHKEDVITGCITQV
jgi:hypothetical protein